MSRPPIGDWIPTTGARIEEINRHDRDRNHAVIVGVARDWKNAGRWEVRNDFTGKVFIMETKTLLRYWRPA